MSAPSLSRPVSASSASALVPSRLLAPHQRSKWKTEVSRTHRISNAFPGTQVRPSAGNKEARSLLVVRAGESTGGDGGGKPPNRKLKEGGDDGDGDGEDPLKIALRRIVRVMIPLGIGISFLPYFVDKVPGFLMDVQNAKFWLKKQLIDKPIAALMGGGDGNNYMPGGKYTAGDGFDANDDGGMSLYGTDFRDWMEASESDMETLEETDYGEHLLLMRREMAEVFGERRYTKGQNPSGTTRLKRKNKKNYRGPAMPKKMHWHRRRIRKGALHKGRMRDPPGPMMYKDWKKRKDVAQEAADNEYRRVFGHNPPNLKPGAV
eukprot:jgi/Bigna1/68239/fgenesh1_pg.5_\